ncbi:MAG TPA: ATP-binding protein [Kofleriaceae bacterium]
MREPRSLRRRLTLWMCGLVAAALAVFAIAAFVVVRFEEEDDEVTSPSDADDPDESAGEQVTTALLVAAPIALGLAAVGAAWLSKRLVRPLEEATRMAAAISVDRFDRRMSPSESDRELGALAVAINDLLDRLQRGYTALAAFAADASHELRTPIAAVCAELETLLRRPRTADEWEVAATTSLAELRRLGAVVDSMLRFAQADKMLSANAPRVDLADVLDEVIAVQQPAAARAGVELRTSLAEGKITARGDADLLVTAVSNLVANGLRYTPEGGQVTVTLRPGPEISVEDAGPGLPPNADALFAPFARGPESTGVGLGLAITRRIVERHGGTVTAANRAGGGACFLIQLPADSRATGPARSLA